MVEDSEKYILYSNSESERFIFTKSELPLRIGRHRDNDLVINNTGVSKHHAEIFLDNGDFKVRDLESKNHTYVNGEMINEQILAPGDCLTFGNHPLNFQEEWRVSSLSYREDFFEEMLKLKDLCLETEAKSETESITGKKLSEDTAQKFLLERIENLEQMYKHIGILLSISNRLSGSLDIDNLMFDIVTELRNVVTAEKVTIFLKSGKDYEKRYESGNFNSRDRISLSTVEKVLNTGEYVLEFNAFENPKLSSSHSISAERIRSILCVPINCRDELLGAIYMDNSSEQSIFNHSHAVLLTAIAGQAGIAFKNAMLIEQLNETHQRDVEVQRLAAIGTFASEISHQMKNSLAPLEGIERLMPFVEGNQEAIELLDSLSGSAERFEQINSSIRKLAWGEINPGWIDAELLFMQARMNCNNILKDRKVNLDLNIEKDFEIFVDHFQMEQVISNMINNAVQALDEAEGKISIAVRKEGCNAVISIRDNGKGITEKQMPHIFDLFYTTRKEQGGDGLGLPLCKAIVLAHGGSIDVNSEPGEETEFIIRLPDHDSISDNNCPDLDEKN